MLFFTPKNDFFLERLSDRVGIWFRRGTIYSQTALEFLDLGTACPGKTIRQRIEYLSPRWITIVEPKNIKELVKCLLFHEAN